MNKWYLTWTEKENKKNFYVEQGQGQFLCYIRNTANSICCVWLLFISVPRP